VSVTASRGLLPWIVAFKAFKAVTLTALGVILLGARHTDAVHALTRVALAVHLPLTSSVLERALRFAVDLTVRKKEALAITAFGYAALMGAEGVGLYLRKPWARWFTVIATSSLLPIEVYEIVRELHLVRVLILIANIAIVVYLARTRELFTRG
jgi:uncharacterized membrane protein (DUF2068 family)